jgi:hypothetical protein
MDSTELKPTDHCGRIDSMREASLKILSGFAWEDTAAGHDHWNKIYVAIAEGIRMEENKED